MENRTRCSHFSTSPSHDHHQQVLDIAEARSVSSRSTASSSRTPRKSRADGAHRRRRRRAENEPLYSDHSGFDDDTVTNGFDARSETCSQASSTRYGGSHAGTDAWGQAEGEWNWTMSATFQEQRSRELRRGH